MCDVSKVLKLQRWLYWLHLLKVDSTSNVNLSHITAWSFATFSFRETKEENRKQSHHSFCPFSYPNNLHTVPNICPPFLSCTSKTSVLPVCHKCVPKYFGTISLSVILTALSHLPFSSSSMMKTLKWVERKREEGEKTFPLRRGSLRVCY